MRDDDLSAQWLTAVPVYWAHGVLAERLDITVEDADRMLRAHADRTGRPLLEIAHDVVEFRLLIDPRDHQ